MLHFRLPLVGKGSENLREISDFSNFMNEKMLRVLALSSFVRRIASPVTTMSSAAPTIKADWLTVGDKILADDGKSSPQE